MSGQKHEVWYENDKKVKRACMVIGDVTTDKVRRTIIKTAQGQTASVPKEWLHPIEPEIAPGTLVYAWDGDEKPKAPVGYYVRWGGFAHEVDVKHKRGESFVLYADHVEPVAMQPEIRWDKLHPSHIVVFVYDSGAVWPSTAAVLYEVGDHDAYGTVVKIISRPKS